MGEDVFARLRPELRRAVAALGYRAPTPIQRQAIPPILEGRDVLGCAQTGTGKTAAFGLPLLHRLAEGRAPTRPGHPRALILAPTRELAAQIGEALTAFGQGLGLPVLTIHGGVSLLPQEEALRRGVAILVATPGRLLDLAHRRTLALDAAEAVVLDEADRMLDMGFLPDIRKIAALLPRRRQTLLFSATFPPEVTALAKSLLGARPVSVRVDPGRPAAERVRQRALFVAQADKYALLKWLLESPKCFRVLIFPRMKHAADRLAKRLTRDGFPAAALHSDKSQGARTRALEAFRQGKIQALVATDIAARGIDVEDVTHVINYDLPDEPETYIHRIGRTARAGAEGEALSLVAPHDRQALRTIERLLGRPVPQWLDQPLHCEAARLAMGADAVRKPSPQRPPRRPR